MTNPNFSTVEKILLNKFKKGESFVYKSNKHTIIESGKPSPSIGGCKTDLYLKTKYSNNETFEFKISLKLDNAEFIENKTSLERAKQILGPNASQIIYDATKSIKSKFENVPLIVHKKDLTYTLMMGWKFEIFHNTTRKLRVQPNLTSTQVEEILSGKNVDNDKKNSKVNQVRISNSGIANIFLEISSDLVSVNNMTLQKIVKGFESISSAANRMNINFGFTALNYRSDKNKWDGNRPLAVCVDWTITNDRLSGALNFDLPLTKKGDDIGELLRDHLETLEMKQTINESDFRNYFTNQDRIKSIK